jgi:hypothetical protein
LRAGRWRWVHDFCIHFGFYFFGIDFHFGKVWKKQGGAK